MSRFPWPSKWTLLVELVMVSISPVPKTPVPVLYFHTDGSTPLPAAPVKVSVQTRVHPGPPGPPGPAACTADEAAAAGVTATTMAPRTATAPIRPRVSLTIATTSCHLTTAWPSSRGGPRTVHRCVRCPNSGLRPPSDEVNGGSDQDRRTPSRSAPADARLSSSFGRRAAADLRLRGPARRSGGRPRRVRPVPARASGVRGESSGSSLATVPSTTG